MLQIGSPWPVVISSIALMGVMCKFLYDGRTLEDQAVHKFAVRIIETFKDKLPPSCREKKDDAQVVNCFLEAKGSNFISSEGSPGFIRDFQEYEKRYYNARTMKITAVALIVFTAISFYVVYEADQILTHPLLLLPRR